MAAKDSKSDNRAKRIYTSAMIDILLADAANGLEIDTDPFYMGDLELRAPNIVFEYTDEEVEEFQKCMMDPIYFIEKYCKFQTDNGRTQVVLREYQKDMIHMLTDCHYDDEVGEFIPNNRNCIIMASRQTAKTTTNAAIMAHYLCFNAHKNIMVLANKDATAKEIVDKIIQIFRGLPYFLKPGAVNFGKTGLNLDNGCRLLSSATTASTSIGFTIHKLFLDEFAHIPRNIIEPFWRSVYPTLSSSKLSQCIITSTPNGQNMFYDIYSKSSIGTQENSFAGMRVDYWQVPEHDDAWADQMRRDFGEELFAQEFELQFNVNSKMFLRGSDFKFMNRVSKKYKTLELFNSNIINNSKLRWHPDFNPYDISPNDKFLFSIDLSEGKEYDEDVKEKEKNVADYNIINIFKLIPNSIANVRSKNFGEKIEIKDCFKFVQVGVYEDNEHDEEYCANVASALAYQIFNTHNNDNVRIMVEINFQGKNFITTMKNHYNFYDELIVKTYHSEPVPGEKRKKKPGFRTTTTKEYFCKKTKRMIEKRRVVINDPRSIKQLASFGRVKGNRLGGIAAHDDLSVSILNTISRATDEELFVGWAEDLIINNDANYKYQLNQLIQKWEFENPEISDATFNNLYVNMNNSYHNYENYNSYQKTYSQIINQR